MSTRSGRIRPGIKETSPPRTRKGVSPNRSPARTRKSSPGRKSSPARKTSPSARTRKSPSRKSPSRKSASQFPARKSPSRATKTVETAPSKSPVKRSAIKTPKTDVSVKLEDLSSKLEIYRGTRSKRIEYSIGDITSAQTDNLSDITKLNGLESNFDEIYGLRNRKLVDEAQPRRSSRLREFIDNVPDIRRSLSKSVSKSVSKSISQSIDTLSDEDSEDDIQREKSRSVTRKLATPVRSSGVKLTVIGSRWEFGGRVGSALLILLIPLTVLSIIISCTKLCSLTSLLDLHPLTSLSTWCSLRAFGVILTQFIVQAIFAIVPLFGTKSDKMDGTGTKYTFNGFFASFFTINTLFVLDFFGLFNKDSLLNDYLRLAVASYVCSVVLSVILHFKHPTADENELNPYGTTGYKLYDFFMGKEIHPHIKRLDVKVWISRVCNINALILAIIIFKHGFHLQVKENQALTLENYKEVISQVNLKPTILTFALMQITYILNFILREYKMTTTFFWQSEGVGYLQTVSSALYPFLFTTVSKFVVDSKLSLSTNTLISASVIYVLGFFIMLLSNSIKYEFRKNPLQPSLANLDSMPTFHGKKLLVAGLWGIVRHPNYTGDILIHIAFALPGILSQQFVAVAPSAICILVLMHRSWRDHARCKRRYGAAWQRYCKRVPSVLIPKVL